MSIIHPRDTVSDFVIDRLLEWGVDHIFGFPGDGIGAFNGALGRADYASNIFARLTKKFAR